MIRPRVREEDLELLLEQVSDGARRAANDAWGKGGPDATVVGVLWACRRIRKSLQRSVAGVRAYESARANGNLPPVLTRVQGYCLGPQGEIIVGDEGKAIYVFQRREQ